MKTQWLHRSLTALFVALFISTPLALTAEPPAAPQIESTPLTPQVRLGVIIVVDQLRGDMVTRYGKWFGKDGFNKLAREGAFYPNAYFTYGSTETAVGHATLGTGRLPRKHGITSNQWYLGAESNTESNTESNQPTPSVFDPDVQAVGTGEGEKAKGYSPRYLLGASLADQLKLADRRSRVFSVSMKPRSAILLAGRNPDGVFWWDQASGNFHTSTWYGRQLPAYVADFNKSRYTDQFIGKTWDKILPEAAYQSCYPLDPKWISSDHGLGKSFPHKLTRAKGQGYDGVYASPFGNEIVLELAKRMLIHEKLGQGPASDLLCVSFSSNDVVGHTFGPNSAEHLDMTVRTDAQIAALLSLIDKQVGLQNCMIALTGDHGVQEVVEVSQQMRLGAERINLKQITSDLNNFLSEQAGQPGEGKDYILSITPPWLWFDPGFADWTLDKQLQVMFAAADYLYTVPGIANAFTAAELEEGPPLREDTERWLAWRSYCPGRSGQIYVSLEPYWYPGTGGTGHGSCQSEDRHVPILLIGAGIKQGRYMREVDPMDIVPTLAAGLGIEPPNNFDGQVLMEAFSER